MTVLNEPVILMLLSFITGICVAIIWHNSKRRNTENRIMLLEHNHTTSISALAEANKKIETAHLNNDALTQLLKDKTFEHSQLQADLIQRSERLANKSEQLTNVLTENSTLKKQVEALADQLKNVFAQNEAQSERLKHLNEQLNYHQNIEQQQRSTLHETQQHMSALQSELTRLKTVHDEKMAYFEHQQTNFEQTKRMMKLEFSELANTLLEEKKKSFSDSNQAALEQILKPFREQILHFQHRVNEVHSESIKGQSLLEAEMKKMLDIGLKMSAEANSLATALKGNKKTIGTWGEAQVERTLQLAGLLKDEHYSTQTHIKDDAGSARLLDFVLKLPDNKHIVIDSKVSLVDYERAVNAETELEQQDALKCHANAIKNHIDDLAQKDYSSLPGLNGPSFVLMFMPIEPAYIEALKSNKELFDYGYKKNVVLVSYTTLLPLLRTVAHLWLMEKSHKEAKLLSEGAGSIYEQVCVTAERLIKLGGSIQAACNHYNNTVKALAGQQGLHAKVQRFGALATRVTKELPEVKTLHQDLDIARLELLLPSSETEPSAAVKQE